VPMSLRLANNASVGCADDGFVFAMTLSVADLAHFGPLRSSSWTWSFRVSLWGLTCADRFPKIVESRSCLNCVVSGFPDYGTDLAASTRPRQSCMRVATVLLSCGHKKAPGAWP